jgi:hypothetical protein
MPDFPHSYLIEFRIPNQSEKTKKEIKGIQIGKEEVKLSLLADNITL